MRATYLIHGVFRCYSKRTTTFLRRYETRKVSTINGGENGGELSPAHSTSTDAAGISHTNSSWPGGGKTPLDGGQGTQSWRRWERPDSMRCWNIMEYSQDLDVLRIDEAAVIPALMKPRQLLVQVSASSINPIDIALMGGYGSELLKLFRNVREGFESLRLPNFDTGPSFPIILGRDFSGTVVDVGKNVTSYRRGDEVWGSVGPELSGGSFAEYIAVDENAITRKPRNIGHVESASFPYTGQTLMSALSCCVDNCVGKRVLVQAGSGGIGSLAIQLFRHWKAHITTTCNQNSVELVAALGADEVYDYKNPDLINQLRSREKFDIILHSLFGESNQLPLDLLKSNSGARFITLAPPLLRQTDRLGIPAGIAASSLDFFQKNFEGILQQKMYFWSFYKQSKEALSKLSTLIEDGNILPVIDSVYSFNELHEALLHFKLGSKQGKVIIKII